MGEPVGVVTQSARETAAPAIPHERLIAVGATVVVVLTIVITAWRDTREWLPTTDWALIELQVRHAIGGFPTLGAPAANGFHHPGPMPYYFLAPVYLLAGSTPHALLMSTAFLNAGAVGGISWTAWRRGRLPFVALTLATIVWLAGSLPAGFLRDPWNPWLALLPFAWFMLLIWSVVVDDLVALPIAALVGSYVVQAHVGYMPVVGVLFLVAFGAVIVRAIGDRRGGKTWPPRRRRLVRVLLLTVLVFVVTWALPIREQLTQHPGNVTLIERSFTGPNVGAHVSAGETVRVAGTEMGPISPWLGFAEPVDGISSTVIPGGALLVLFPIALLAVGFVMSRHNHPARAFVVVVAAADAAAVIALSRLEQDRVFPYVLRFTWVLAAFTVLATVWALAARDETPHVPRAISGVGLALVAVGLIRFVVLDGSAMIPIYHPEQHAAEAACIAQLLPALNADRGSGAAQVTTAEFWPIIAAPLVNELDRTGAHPRVDPHLGFFTAGSGLETYGGNRDYVVVDLNEKPDWQPDPGMTQVASCDTLTPAERADVTAIAAKTDRTTADGIRLIDLAPRNVRAAVYRLP